MSLAIIADNKSELLALEEAFKAISIIVHTYSDFTKINDIETHSMVLVVVNDDNLSQAQDVAEKKDLFAIIDPVMNEVENMAFEEVFMRPLRLGYTVDVVKQAIAQQRQHQLMAVINFGKSLRLDPKNSHLYGLEDKKSVHLTEKETAILVFLNQNKDIPIPRQKLLNEVWGYADNVETHTLETHIYRLRQKILTRLGVDDFLVTSESGYVLNF